MCVRVNVMHICISHFHVHIYNKYIPLIHNYTYMNR